MTFFKLFCTTKHPQLGTAHVSCQGDRGTQMSQLLSLTQESQPYTTKLLVPRCHYQPCQRRTDGGLSPERCPCLSPRAWQSSLPLWQDPREQTWTARGMPKLHIPSFILLPVDGMDIPCYLKQLSTLLTCLAGSVLEISTFKHEVLSSGRN